MLRGADGAVIERLRSVTRALVELGEQEVYAMQRSITLDIDVDPVEVVAGDTSEVGGPGDQCLGGSIAQRACYGAAPGRHD